MDYSVGDKVCFSDREGFGWVQSFCGASVVVCIQEVDITVPRSVLIKSCEDEEMLLSDSSFDRKSPSDARVATPRNVFREVDLHYDQLPTSYRFDESKSILERQIAYARSVISQAISDDVRTLVLIHGVGEDILRREIRLLLECYGSGLRFEPACDKRYGRGATLVRFR